MLYIEAGQTELQESSGLVQQCLKNGDQLTRSGANMLPLTDEAAAGTKPSMMEQVRKIGFGSKSYACRSATCLLIRTTKMPKSTK